MEIKKDKEVKVLKKLIIKRKLLQVNKQRLKNRSTIQSIQRVVDQIASVQINLKSFLSTYAI